MRSRKRPFSLKIFEIKAIFKKAAKTPYEKKLETVNYTPLVIADAQGVYNELNYYKVKDILDYNSKTKLDTLILLWDLLIKEDDVLFLHFIIVAFLILNKAVYKI